LTAQARKLSNGGVAAFVLPQFVTNESQLFYVKNEFNGVVIESALSDKQFLYGKGAGRYPTSSAVLSDISALRYDYKYEYKKLKSPVKNLLTDDFYLRVYVSFTSWSDIDRDDFEWLEEYYSNEIRQYLVGVIHFEKLKNAEWFQKDSISLIVWPKGIIESIELRRIQKKSLELAGVL
jgi:homoserine dehydrogenase